MIFFSIMYRLNMWYFSIAIVVVSKICIMEAAKNFSMTSHGKIVMCNVAEVSINAEYNIEEHDLNLCTHLIYFKTDNGEKGSLNSSQFFNSNFDTVPDKKLFELLPKIREQYPHLKICFGVNNLPVDFSEMASVERKRRQFFNHGITFLLNNHFDGLDLSWDIEKERFKPNVYLQFVKELKEHLQWNHLLLSAKVSANNETLNNGHNLSALSLHLDIVHFTLDYRIDPNRKYYTLVDAFNEHGISHFEYVIDKLIEMGISPSKLVAGFNFGGLKLDTAYRTQRYLGYNEICKTKLNEEWTQSFDSGVSLAVTKKKDEIMAFWRHLIVFENERSIIHRIRFAMLRNLAGAMATWLNTDDLHGNCKNGNEEYNDFTSPHVAITLTMSEENNATPLLNTINIMMVMALYELDQEAKLSNETNLLSHL